jgi:uncharacterized protein (UPF0371 family)
LGDYNLIDPFCKKEKAINYNRDVEAFPIIKRIFAKMLPKSNYARNYKSPTEMGFNRLSAGMIEDKKLREAAKKEINFYLFRYREEFKKGLVEERTLKKMGELLKKAKIREDYLVTVKVARQQAEAKGRLGKKKRVKIYCGAGIELRDGSLLGGKNSTLLHAEAAVLLNVVKQLAGIDDGFDLISPSVIKQINQLNKKLGDKSCSLDASETMMALAVSARDNPLAKKALACLPKIKGCFMHTTHRPSVADSSLFRKLGLWVSTDGRVA